MNILKYFIIFIFQLVYNFLRTEEIQLTNKNKLGRVLLNTVLMNLVILASTYYSFSLLLSGNWFVGVVYVAGAVIGKWIGFKKIN